jgi:hypothetical protein
MQSYLQDRTCPRFGLRFQVAPSGNDPGTAHVDIAAFKQTCQLQSDTVTAPSHCPEVRKAWSRPMPHDPKETS